MEFIIIIVFILEEFQNLCSTPFATLLSNVVVLPDSSCETPKITRSSLRMAKVPDPFLVPMFLSSTMFIICRFFDSRNVEAVPVPEKNSTTNEYRPE